MTAAVQRDAGPADRRGPLYMLGASLAFASMGLCVKYVSDAIPLGEVVFFRSVIATVLAAMFGWGAGRRLLGVNRRMLLTRGLVGLASMFAYFYAISRLKLGDAVLLTYLSPLFVTLMSPVVLGERPPRTIWIALALGFSGVWVVAEPGGARLPIDGLAAGLASAVLAAGAYVSVKLLSRTDDTATIVLWFSVSAMVVSGVVAAFRWVTPTPLMLAGLAGVGVFAGIAQFLMTKAYAVSRAAEVSIYAYATPVTAYALGHVALGENPGWRGAIGTGLLVLAGASVTLFAARRSDPT